MSFHRHSCPSIMIIYIFQPQTGGVSAGYGRVTFFFFWATGMVPYTNCVLCILVSFISHRPDPDRKDTFKGAGAWSFLAVVFFTLRNAVCHGNRVDSDLNLGLFISVSACEATSSFATFNMSVQFMVKHLIFVISSIKSTNKVYTNYQ